MAIDYTELFTSIGKAVKHYNAQLADAQNLVTDVAEIEAAFAAEDKLDVISGLNPESLDGWQTEHVNRRAALAAYVQRRLLDPALLIELGAPSADIATVFSLLFEKMVTDSQSINASAAAAGSTAAAGTNVGNGTVKSTILLDRVTSPGTRQGVTMAADHSYGNLNSELIVPETITFRCIADSYYDGLTEGAEQFEVTGNLPDQQHGVQTYEGSGTIGTFSAAHADTAQYLSNADFENWSVTNVPDNWTIDAGTAGTHIFEETNASLVYHGGSSLHFLGTGAQATIQVSQAPPAGALKAGRMYFVSLRLRCDSAPAAGDFLCSFSGTGYTPGSSEKITIAAASLPTSFTLYSFVALMPLNLPSDMKLILQWSGTPSITKDIYCDDVSIQPVNYAAGFGANIVRGSVPFVRDDRFTVALTNTEGVFAAFFRRAFGIQLRSNAAAGETISDSLAS